MDSWEKQEKQIWKYNRNVITWKSIDEEEEICLNI